MPIVTLSVPDGHSVPLREVADAVAEALELGAGDVIAVALPYFEIARSGGAVGADWVIVSVHGSDRGRQSREAALGAAQAAVVEWAQASTLEIEGVWCEWLLP